MPVADKLLCSGGLGNQLRTVSVLNAGSVIRIGNQRCSTSKTYEEGTLTSNFALPRRYSCAVMRNKYSCGVIMTTGLSFLLHSYYNIRGTCLNMPYLSGERSWMMSWKSKHPFSFSWGSDVLSISMGRAFASSEKLLVNTKSNMRP